MQVLLSAANVLPEGQKQIPPFNDGPHLCSHPNAGQERVAEGGREGRCSFSFMTLIEKKWQILTTSGLFVGSVFAILFAITQLYFGDALGLSVGPSFGAQELIV